MYQLNSVDGRRIINGYQIVVLKGHDIARIDDRNNREVFRGTCEACEQFIRDRAMLAPRPRRNSV